MLKKVALAVAAAFVAQAASASSIDFHGYIRDTFGSSSEGGGVSARFTTDGAGYPGAFRLGNEGQDNYAELAFSTVVLKTPAGAKWSYHYREAFGVPSMKSSEPTSFNNREDFVTAEGLFTSAPSASLWAGKRFYRESDLHMRDFYYWNMSGAGLGIEGIKAGPGTLAFAWIKSENDTGGSTGDPVNSANLFDVNYNNIKLGSFTGQVRAAYAHANPDGHAGATSTNVGEVIKTTNDGYGLLFALNENVWNGFNKTVVQGYWGSLSSPNFNWYEGQDGTPDNRASLSAHTYRVFDFIAVEPTTNFALQGLALYERGHGNADLVNGTPYGSFQTNFTWAALGVRPIYSLTDYFALQGEISREKTHIEQTTGSVGPALTKFTFAPTFRAGKGAWARPEVRLFYTYAMWNKDNGSAGTGTTFENANGQQQYHGANWGVSVEAWW